MARAKLSRIDVRSMDGIRLFTEQHIVGVRKTPNGYIRAVKHVQFGWMKPEEFYRLQKVHEVAELLGPSLAAFIEGGYRLKAAIWSTTVRAEVLGTGLTIPVGAALGATEVLNAMVELSRKPIDPQMLAIRLYALLGPFGDLIQIADTMIAAVAAGAGIANFIAPFVGFAGGLFSSLVPVVGPPVGYLGPIPIPANPYQPPGTVPTLE